MLWALVPAKLGPAVKTRLGVSLTPEQRHALAQAMLADVLTALAGAPSLAGVAVITRDEPVATLAARHDAVTVHELPGGDLNHGVAQGVAACAARGASGVVIVMGDLPNVTSEEIERAVAVLPPRGVVLVPSFDGTGTNVLGMRPVDLLRATAFGPDSLARHRHAASDLEVVLCPLRGAALDVDTVEDLQRLVRGGTTGAATQGVLAMLGDVAIPARGA